MKMKAEFLIIRFTHLEWIRGGQNHIRLLVLRIGSQLRYHDIMNQNCKKLRLRMPTKFSILILPFKFYDKIFLYQPHLPLY